MGFRGLAWRTCLLGNIASSLRTWMEWLTAGQGVTSMPTVDHAGLLARTCCTMAAPRLPLQPYTNTLRDVCAIV